MQGSCDKYLDMIYDYIDAVLDDEQKAEFEAHISECKSCRAELEAALETVKLMHAAREEMPYSIENAVLDRIEKEAYSLERRRFIKKMTAICASVFAVTAVVVCTKLLIPYISEDTAANESSDMNMYMKSAEAELFEVSLEDGAELDFTADADEARTQSNGGLQYSASAETMPETAAEAIVEAEEAVEDEAAECKTEAEIVTEAALETVTTTANGVVLDYADLIASYIPEYADSISDVYIAKNGEAFEDIAEVVNIADDGTAVYLIANTAKNADFAYSNSSELFKYSTAQTKDYIAVMILN